MQIWGLMMKYGEIYNLFKDKKYDIKFDSIGVDSDIIKYDSDNILINGVQFKIAYDYINLSRYDLRIFTIDDRLGYQTVVELRIKLEDIDELGIGTKWWDDNEN